MVRWDGENAIYAVRSSHTRIPDDRCTKKTIMDWWPSPFMAKQPSYQTHIRHITWKFLDGCGFLRKWCSIQNWMINHLFPDQQVIFISMLSRKAMLSGSDLSGTSATTGACQRCPFHPKDTFYLTIKQVSSFQEATSFMKWAILL